MSPLYIAISRKHEDIVKLILEKTDYDICSDISEKSLETCIHTACRVAVSMSFMQLLLTNIRASFDEDKQKIGDFLDKVNRDGLKASDYCWKTNHR